MLVILGIASIVLTAILVATGLVIGLAGQKPENNETKPPGNKRSLWYYFGFFPHTDNTIWAIVSGLDEENNSIKGIRSNMTNRVWDPTIRRIRPLKVIEVKKVEQPDGSFTDIPVYEDQFENEGSLARFFRVRFGVFYYGFPLWTSVKPLYIDRVTRKLTADQKAKLAEQLSANTELVKKYGLYGEFPRPTYHDHIDLGGGVIINLISYAEVVVDDPMPAFTKYKDSFLQTISDYTGTYVSSRLLNMGWDDYKKDREKGEKFRDLSPLDAVLSPLGVRVVVLPFSDPEITPESQKILDALAAEKIAIEEGKATVAKAEADANARRKQAFGNKDAKITEAEGTKKATVLEAEGTAEATEKIAAAKAKRVEEVYKQTRGKFLTDEDAITAALAHVEREFTANAVSNLTGVYAPGGGAPVQLSVQTPRPRIVDPAGDKK